MTTELLKKALEISEKRRHILVQLREAIKADDKDAVFLLARKLTGLNDEERPRAHQSLN